MQRRYSGTAAAFEFTRRPLMSFGTLVAECDRKLNRDRSGQSLLTRDGDDLAVFDRGPLRIALGWVEPGVRKKKWYLIIAVGPSPVFDGPQPDDATMTAMAGRLLEHAQARFPTDSVFRCDINRQIDPDLLDDLIEAVLNTDMPATEGLRHDRRGPVNTSGSRSPQGPRPDADCNIIQVQSRRAQKTATARPSCFGAAQPCKAGERTGNASYNDEYDRISRLRKMLTDKNAKHSIRGPMHMALHRFSLLMTPCVPTVGAALLVYNILSEDSLPFFG